MELAGPTNKHFCMTCRKFYKLDDFRMEWVYENAESTEMEKPEGRCVNCWNIIKKHTDELLAVIDK